MAESIELATILLTDLVGEIERRAAALVSANVSAEA